MKQTRWPTIIMGTVLAVSATALLITLSNRTTKPEPTTQSEIDLHEIRMQGLRREQQEHLDRLYEKSGYSRD